MVSRLLGLPVCCGASVALDHFEQHCPVVETAETKQLYSTEPVFLCPRCQKTGHVEDFDERARRLDARLGLPMEPMGLFRGHTGIRRRGKAWESVGRQATA